MMKEKKMNRVQQASMNATGAFFEPETEVTEVTEVTEETQETQKTEVTQPTKEELIQIVKQSSEIAKKVGRPNERGETYRFSLYLDGDLKGFVKYMAWKNKQSTTQYFNNLVRAEMKAYLEAGGNADEWNEND